MNTLWERMKDNEFNNFTGEHFAIMKYNKISILFICLLIGKSFSDTTWEIILEENDTFNINHIYDIEIDDQGYIWAGFDYGFGVYDGSSLQIIDSDLVAYSIVSKDPNGNIWLKNTTTSTSNLIIYTDINTYRYFKSNDSLPVYNINDIILSYEGLEYFPAIYKGVFSKKDNVWYNHYPSYLPYNTYSEILKDQKSNIWVSSRTKGAACFDGTVWSLYDSTKSPLKRVYCMAADSSGNMWFSSVEEVAKPQHGLFKFDGENWTQYNSENSNLPYNDSYGMVVDRAGYLWLITAKCDFLRFTGDTFEIRDNSWFPRYGAAADNMLVDYRNRIVIGFRHKPLLIYDQHKDDCGSVTRIDMHVPKEGKEYKAGTTLPILWATVGCIDSVTIEYRTGSSEWQKIAGPVLNRMPYHWTVPSTLSSQYQIRVSKSDEPEINAVSSHFSVISNTANNPPEFIKSPDTITIAPNSTFTWTVSVRDPDNDPVTLSFENMTDWMSVSGNELTFTPLAGDTDTVITVTASDNNDGEKTISVCVLVRPPVSVSMIKNKQLNSKPQRIEIFDFRGKRLKVMENSAYLKNTGLSSGSYILKHMTGKNVSYRKFVVNSR